MSTSSLDPLMHNPERLRVVAILAALPDGDGLSVTRLQDMLGLPAGSVITCLGALGRAGYVRTGNTGDARADARAQTTVALTFLVQDPGHIDGILADGSARARVIAAETMRYVKDIVGFVRN